MTKPKQTQVEETPAVNANDERKAAALNRKIAKQERWRNKVWADCELRIRAANDELAEIGFEQVEVEIPDFDDDLVLHTLAESEA